MSFLYNSIFFLLSSQLVQRETAKFQGRFRPDQWVNLKLTGKIDSSVVELCLLSSFEQKKKPFFTLEAVHITLSCWLVSRNLTEVFS